MRGDTPTFASGNEVILIVIATNKPREAKMGDRPRVAMAG
jgi:hypothetical protein